MIEDHAPCCSCCAGRGYDTYCAGACWDCMGTGHSHAPDDGKDQATGIHAMVQRIGKLDEDGVMQKDFTALKNEALLALEMSAQALCAVWDDLALNHGANEDDMLGVIEALDEMYPRQTFAECYKTHLEYGG